MVINMYDFLTLEFNKIINKLVNYAICDFSKNEILKYENLDYSYSNILKMQNEVSEAYDSIIKLDSAPIYDLSGIDEILMKASKGAILSAKELLLVNELIKNSIELKRFLKQISNLLETKFQRPYYDAFIDEATLKSSIELAISLDGEILDNASRELFVCRRSKKSLEARLRTKLTELIQTRSKMLTEPIIVQRDFRMCLPVKVEYKNTFKGIIHDISSSSTTVYIEPEEIIPTQNQIDQYQAQEKKEIEIILKNLTLLVSAQSDELMNMVSSIKSLDIIYAKAKMGKDLGYSLAKVIDDKKFNLKNALHPLIDKDKCVPLNINLGHKQKCIIITGPNTGGKTVSLKTTGLLHLMAYNGLMVPLSQDSEFGYFKNIMADIGDEQSIEQSLSTFSSHMTKISRIINESDDRSLILLDELGSGTDPKEGSSLAISIINYLKNKNSLVIATTHYSDLKSYAYENDDIINASVEFNTDTLMPTYKLLMGIPGKSNALDIAKRIGINDEIVSSAREYLNNNKGSNEVLIGNIEEEMNNLRLKEESLEKEIEKYNKENYKLKQEKIELVKKTDKIIADARRDAQKILDDAKDEANKLIQEIKNMSEENFKEHELINLKTKANSLHVEEKEEDIFLDELNVGDFVYIKPYEKYGTISQIKKDKYYVKMGNFLMDFKKSDLQLSAKPVEKPKKKERLSGYNSASHATLSLDLRGKRYEDVTYLMDQYLDQAVLGNLEEVSIIHGFGTGTIRKAVWEYLKKCPYAKSWRYGGEGEGLNGVTVVKLK